MDKPIPPTFVYTQDRNEICHPSGLGDLLTFYRQASEYIGSIVGSGTIVDCIIPLHIIDGTIVNVSGSYLSTPLWGSGLIETYVNLPELFRTYFEQIKDFYNANIQPLSGYWLGHDIITQIDAVEYGPYPPSQYRTELISPSGETNIYIVSGNINPPVTTPEWTGFWANGGYNINTIPQLVSGIVPMLEASGIEPPTTSNGGGSTMIYIDVETSPYYVYSLQELNLDFYVNIINWTDAPISIPISSNVYLIPGTGDLSATVLKVDKVAGTSFWVNGIYYSSQSQELHNVTDVYVGINIIDSQNIIIQPKTKIQLEVRIVENSQIKLNPGDPPYNFQALQGFDVSVGNWRWAYTGPIV